MKKVELTKGKFAIVDNEDFEFVNQWKWSFDGLYAVRGHYLGEVNGKDKYKKIYLHREINETLDNMETDHINRNKLDNRRCNLRSVTKGQNNRNRDAFINNIVGVSGVHWYSKLNKYRASIGLNKKRIHLGYFTNLKEAVFARKQAERRYYAI